MESRNEQDHHVAEPIAPRAVTADTMMALVYVVPANGPGERALKIVLTNRT
jgi:hypothetical protein